jgi:hypothetical protein
MQRLETMGTWSFILLIGVFAAVWGGMIDVMVRESLDDPDSQADDAFDV